MDGELAGGVHVSAGAFLKVAEVGDATEVFVLDVRSVVCGKEVVGGWHTFRSITSRFDFSSSAFTASSGCASVDFASSGGMADSGVDFGCSDSVDCRLRCSREGMYVDGVDARGEMKVLDENGECRTCACDSSVRDLERLRDWRRMCLWSIL